jgi:Asp-tRNA(Asn)/Glu-tRNA(Gln) amidotransferase A subunit family amidase
MPLKWPVLTLATSLVLFKLVCALLRRLRQQANLKQARLEAARQWNEAVQFAATLPALSPQTTELILSSTARGLLDLIRAKKLTSEQITIAFVRQTIKAQAATACVTVPMFQTALQLARKADQLDEKEACLRPLHGLPISVKDCVIVGGFDTSNGCSALLGKPRPEDGLAMSLLKEAGAIPFVKTNIPLTLLSYECENFVYGKGLSAHNPKFTPGGSSGGEGALLACRGSPLGVGTDIGGSLRIPAAWSGVCALKPTHKRVCKKGLMSSVPGQETVPGIVGPMARNVDDLALWMHALVNTRMSDLDPDIVPMPFRDNLYRSTNKPVIGYYEHDGAICTSPATARPVREVAKALKDAGFDVRVFSPPLVNELIITFYALMGADGGQTVRAGLRGDPMTPAVKHIMAIASLRGGLRILLNLVARGGLLGDQEYGRLVQALGEKSVKNVWELQAKKQQLTARFHAAWRAAGVDVLLCPSQILPNIQHGCSRDVSFAACSTFIYNVMDFPAGVLTVGKVSRDDVWVGSPATTFERKLRAHYDPVAAAGLPVGVQVVGLPFNEELVLNVMKSIETLCPSPFADGVALT